MMVEVVAFHSSVWDRELIKNVVLAKLLIA